VTEPASLANVCRELPYKLTPSTSVAPGQQVSTVGYPLTSLLGSSPKFSEGVISSKSGLQDDPRNFQISEALADAIAVRLERMASCNQRLLEVEQAAEYMGMTPTALRHKAGVEVPVVKIDSKLRFDRRDLDRYIDQAPREGV
jgi:hypothetical protein